MPLRSRDREAYRRDERMGHKLLTPEQRMEMIKPYLPTPPSRSRSRPRTASNGSQTTPDAKSSKRLSVRRFLRRQYHMLVFAIIHFFFSLYIRLRQAYHAVGSKIYSVYHHHHSTPELIRRDVQGLARLPNHLSVILTKDEGRWVGDEFERLIEEVTEVAAWCASAGIPQLSVYEKTGLLKEYLKEAHRRITQKLHFYFGPDHPSVSIGAPHLRTVSSKVAAHGTNHSTNSNTSNNSNNSNNSDSDGEGEGSRLKHISVLLISAEDGRDSMVDLTKTLAEMAQRKKLNPADITPELVDAELSESIMSEPDLLLLFGPHVELAGYPPWQVRLTEIFHVQDNQGVNYQVFIRGLHKFAQAQMRKGR